MRPLLNPGLRRVWRAPDTVQFGIDVTNPVVLTGVDDETVDLLSLLDGSHFMDEVIDVAVRKGHNRERAEQTLATLCGTPAIIDGSNWPGGRSMTTPARARLAPDMALAMVGNSSTAQTPHRHELLANRGVRVYGLSRLGATIATMLAAAGLGRVELVDDQKVTAADVFVGGHQTSDIGYPRTALLERLALWGVTTHPPDECTLAVVTDASDSRSVAAELTRQQVPHLVVGCAEEVGRIGPFVDPGRTACLRCYDFTRTDQDPHWPMIVLQLDGASRQVVGDGMLTNTTASIAVLHLIDWLSGGQPPSENAVLELWRPHGEATAHRLCPHAACGCAWSEIAGQETMAG